MQNHLTILFKTVSLVIFLGAIGCKTPYYKSPNDTFPKIMISEGGGFTGAMTYYFVLPNGQVFFKDTRDTLYNQMNPMSKKEAKKLIGLVRQKLTEGEEIHEPDNIYRSISYIEIDGSNTATWYRNRNELDELYNAVLTKITAQNVVR